jgi:hypothetical protein
MLLHPINAKRYVIGGSYWTAKNNISGKKTTTKQSIVISKERLPPNTTKQSIVINTERLPPFFIVIRHRPILLNGQSNISGRNNTTKQSIVINTERLPPFLIVINTKRLPPFLYDWEKAKNLKEMELRFSNFSFANMGSFDFLVSTT